VNLFNVMTEIDTALDTIAGLRSYPWAQGSISPPAAVQLLPDEIDYHGTYGAGQMVIKDHVIVLMIGRSSDRAATKLISDYVAPTGVKSIKAKLETYAYTTCDVVNVDRVEFDTVTVGTGNYLAALFHTTITGTGA
jgi:hypothetical protein